MSAVHLQVLNPGGISKSFILSEHDTFLLGRMADCYFCVPGDPQVSRHHFLLKFCPLMVSLHDLGLPSSKLTMEWNYQNQANHLNCFNARPDPKYVKPVSAVIDKALVRNPKDRFPDAGKLQASLPKPRS